MSKLIYPGLVCEGVEIFTSNGSTKFIKNGTVKNINELPFPIIETIQKVIDDNQKLKAELEFHHPNSTWKQIEMFCKCRYGGLDFYPDMKSGELSEGDYWDCPVRGSCRSEGVICNSPKYNGQVLSNIEIQLIQLLSTTKTNETIADKMHIALGSFHLIKKKLYKKLQIQTKQELTLIAVRLNLINL